jgi:hypothetical protein
MKSRTDKNSTTAAVAGFQGSMGSLPLPEGITLRSDEEHVIWGQFMRARDGRLAGHGSATAGEGRPHGG